MSDRLTITEEFERAACDMVDDLLVLRLYVAGNAYQSASAVERVKQICESRLPGRYQLEVIDLYQQPALAERDQIVALPTLVKISPAPVRRVVGDMSDMDRVLYGIGVVPEE